MKLLFDSFPLILFFGAFKLYDIYVATAVAILASIVQVSWFWYKNRRVEVMHMITLGVIVVFGGLTLFLQNDVFIRWKPTIIYWLFATIVLGSHFIGKRPAIQRLLGSQITLPDGIWRKLNIFWGIFMTALGALNIYVAFYYALDMDPKERLDLWVDFKVFGTMGLTLVFLIGQKFRLSKHMVVEEDSSET